MTNLELQPIALPAVSHFVITGPGVDAHVPVIQNRGEIGDMDYRHKAGNDGGGMS